METMVVAAFEELRAADFGATILRGLQSQGKVRIHALAVLGRSAAGEVTNRPVTESAAGRHAEAVQVIAQSLLSAVEPGAGTRRSRRGAGRLQRRPTAATSRARSGVDTAWLRVAIGCLRRGGAVVIASLREQRVTAVDRRMELSGGIVFRQTRPGIVHSLLRVCGIGGDAVAVDARGTAERALTGLISWLRTRFAPARATRKIEPLDLGNSGHRTSSAPMTSRDVALGLARGNNRRIRRRPG